jgi:hypothetical protein
MKIHADEEAVKQAMRNASSRTYLIQDMPGMPNAVSMKQKRETDIYLSHSYPGFIPFIQYKKPLSASNKNTTEEQALLGFLGDRLVKGENSLRQILLEWSILGLLYLRKDRLCGPVVRVLG